MPTYGNELHLTWIVLLGIAAVYGYVGWARLSYGIRFFQLRTSESIAAVYSSSFYRTLQVALAFFPSVFSTLNLLSQDLVSIDFWRAELSSGVFALRVSSYLLTFHFVRVMNRHVRLRRRLIEVRLARGVPKHELCDYEIDLKSNERKLLVARNAAQSASHQYVFYLSAVAALWLCAIEGRHSLVVTLASWCVFFIVDDWVVITDYANHFRSPVLSSHHLKITVFNLILIGLIPASLYGSSFTFVSIVLCLLLLHSFLWSLMARTQMELVDLASRLLRRDAKKRAALQTEKK